MKVKVNDSRCKECGLCVAHCPRGAISFTAEMNEKGYRTTIVDDEKCIACGMCYLTCPDGVYHVLG